MQRAKLQEALEIGQAAIESADLPFRVIETEWVQVDRALRFYIDRTVHNNEQSGPESDSAGIQMEDCARVSKIVSEIASLDDLVNGEYNLEVSSPGIERPVRLRQDFDDRIGQVLKVRISGVVEGKRQETGELILLPSGDFAIKTLTGPWPFKLENVLRAHLVYDWSQEKS